MSIVHQHHDAGTRGDCFKFRSNWLDDKQVVAFFENGIKNAVTIEEIRRQAREHVHCYVGAYMYETSQNTGKRDTRYKTTLDAYPKTSDELSDWVQLAKAERNRLIDNKLAEYAYVCIQVLTEEPMTVYPRETISEPCVLKGRHGYIRDVTSNSVSYSTDIKDAKVFKDSDDAYLAMDQNPNAGAVKVLKADKVGNRKTRPQNVVLSVERGGMRVYVHKLTAKSLSFVYQSQYAKKFASGKAAMQWYEKYVGTRFPNVSLPQTEVLANA